MFSKKIISLLVISVLAYPVNAASQLKVGTIDSERILHEYTAAQKMMQELGKAEAELNKKIADKRAAILKAKQQNKTETELQMLAEQMRLEIEPEAKKIEEETNKKSEKVEEDIRLAIESVAKKGKYDLVLIKEAVLYGSNDVTSDVLKTLK